MHRIPAANKTICRNYNIHRTLTSNNIRSSFIEYFSEKHAHKQVKSSSVVPLCDSTVPFVNAGMNQFKGVFLGLVDAPYPRVVNSQKCIRVGGKHNDLELVGVDGHHHTFFEMLGNWSFGDYYKKEACQMAWDLLLGPFRLKPEDLLVTYFGGDIVIGIPEDRECRDIWKSLGVSTSRLYSKGVADNFWEMGAMGPCGGCTEVHYVGADGNPREIWNLVFIDHNREADGSVKKLRRQHVDTGMGLERMTALLQGVRTNYETDLFRPLLDAIHRNAKGVSPYGGNFSANAVLDQAYRRLADHARMISVCLADGVFPATNLNLKQIMRKSFKICIDVFQNPQLLSQLYTEVAKNLGEIYPELISKQKDANIIIEHERESYVKLRTDIGKKWKGLVQKYPEVEILGDIETAGFTLGYTEFKETMSKLNSSTIPGELVFKLYDTHGFQEDVVERIAKINSFTIDKKGFWKHLSQHKSRHKSAFKEQNNKKGFTFDGAIERLIKGGVKCTNDSYKYNYLFLDNSVVFEPLKSNLVAIINEDGEWIDYLDPCEDSSYYLVTDITNFYCEEGGQVADSGSIRVGDHMVMKVESVFKIRDFVFHKGRFISCKTRDKCYVKCKDKVSLEIDSCKRLSIMRNHTGVHLLNAAIRKVLPNSVVCQIGSKVTDTGLSLNLSIYGEKLTQKVLLEAQDLVRATIKSNTPVVTRVMDGVQLQEEPPVLTVPGETYPEQGLRLVSCGPPLESRELCCGTHAPTCGQLQQFCVSAARGAGGHAPTVHALTGGAALQARELFCHAERLSEVVELTESGRVRQEAAMIREQLAALCGDTGGAPCAEHAACLQLLRRLETEASDINDTALHGIAEAEILEAISEALRSERGFAVHFVRSSYLMEGDAVSAALAGCAGSAPLPTLLLACSGGVIRASAAVPQEYVGQDFTAARWLGCVLPVFSAALREDAAHDPRRYAEMTASKASLITCEQLVQDAMRIAIKFAQAHVKKCNGQNREQSQERSHGQGLERPDAASAGRRHY